MLVHMLFALMMTYVSAHVCPYGSEVCDYCPGLRPNPIVYSQVTGCTSSPCHFKPGENIHVKVKFIALADSPTAPLKITITIGGAVIADSVDGGDLCQHMAPECPLVKGKQYTMEYDLPSNIPLGCSTFKAWVVTPQGQIIYCQTINVCIDP